MKSRLKTMEHTQTKRTAVVFLCKDLHEQTAKFADMVYYETEFEVFVVVDSDKAVERNYGFSVIQVKDKICIENGYVGCNIDGKATHIQKQVIAWDKFLYAFCEVIEDFDFVWVFEDDVFIPSLQSIKHLHKKYSSSDLVVPNNFRKSDNIMDWHWKHIVDKIQPPYFYSMVCACGMSFKMLNKIKEYKNKNNCLLYIEVMFNTLAMQDREFKVSDPIELKSVVWMGDWNIDEFLLLPNNVFHPIKNLQTHPELRTLINEAKESNYLPKNNLPEFIKRHLNYV